MQCKKPQQKILIRLRVIARQSLGKSQHQANSHSLLNFVPLSYLAVFTTLKKQQRQAKQQNNQTILHQIQKTAAENLQNLIFGVHSKKIAFQPLFSSKNGKYSYSTSQYAYKLYVFCFYGAFWRKYQKIVSAYLGIRFL